MPADNTRPVTKVVGCLRVSTKMQGESGLGLAAQRAAVEGYTRQVGAPVLAIFEEVESGTRADRPQLAAAIRQCELTGAALVAARIDRFGREAADLFKLRDARFPVIAVDTPNADGFLFGILALVAEKERDSISERTKVALAAAKARGTKLGKPENLSNCDIGSARGKAMQTARAVARAEDLAPMLDEMRKAGTVSMRGMARELNARGITAPHGGRWHGAQVARVLARAGKAAAAHRTV